MKNKYCKKIFLGIIIFLIVVLISGNVHAIGGQASGTSNRTGQTVSYFFELIRAMESPTGSLGVPSSINVGNGYIDEYIGSDNKTNGIDCHLEKNTEYGTITLLAASEYGNDTSTNSASTGLGSTGVFQMYDGKYEYVANTWSSEQNGTPTTTSCNGALTSADARYVNKYYGTKGDFTSRGYVIKGDGLIQTDGWGGVTNFVDSSKPVFCRGVTGLFGYYNFDGNSSGVNGARAVVVCGTGL